jgi:4-carboxymuconolactone decarboxylase
MTRRLAGLRRSDLSPEQDLLYQQIVSGPRASGSGWSGLIGLDGALRGPFNAMLLSPSIGAPLQALGASIRFESRLTDRERELAVLVVANEWNSPFEWETHEPLAVEAGATAADIAAIVDRTPLPDRAVVVARELVENGRLDDEAYRGAVAALGLQRLFELTTLVGYYSALALQMRVFWD